MSKEFMLRVRMSREQQEVWAAAANADKMALSEWVRRRCNDKVTLAVTEVEMAPNGEGIVLPAGPVKGKLVLKAKPGGIAGTKRIEPQVTPPRPNPLAGPAVAGIPATGLAAVFGRLATTNAADLSKPQLKGGKV